jgi:hypothetical protein
MKFKFTSNLTLEATSEEDAVRKVVARFMQVASHLGAGKKLAATKPPFTLAPAPDKSAVTDLADPLAPKPKEG